MRAFSGILGILLVVFLGIACGETQSQLVGTITPTPAPEVGTPESSPVSTPEPTPLHFQDPTEEHTEQAREIYKTLPTLPATEEYRIEYYDNLSGTHGIFHIVVTADNGVEYQEAVEEALNFFRQFGYEPCEAPLAAVISIVWPNRPRATAPPSPGYKPWEPCK